MNRMRKLILMGIALVFSMTLGSCGSKDPKNMSQLELIQRADEIVKEMDKAEEEGDMQRALHLAEELHEICNYNYIGEENNEE